MHSDVKKSSAMKKVRKMERQVSSGGREEGTKNVMTVGKGTPFSPYKVSKG